MIRDSLNDIEAAGSPLGLSTVFLKTLVKAILARDRSTGVHSGRVARYSLLIGKKLGLSKYQLQVLHQGALLHDIGKIGIQDSILYKPGKLTAREFGTIRKHPTIGAGILSASTVFAEIVPAVLHHHERYDGTGYPYGLKGQDIPLVSRIIAVADSFEAMISERPYRHALSTGQAVDELGDNAGTQFDSEIVEAFIGLIECSPGVI